MNTKPLRRIGQVAVFLAANAIGWAQSSPTGDAASATTQPAPVATPLPEAPYAPQMPSIVQNVTAEGEIDLGESALENDYIPIAIYIFKQELDKPGLTNKTRDTLNLDLVTAYLGMADQANATAALAAVGTTDTPAYLLRAALLQELNGKWDDAKALVARLDVAGLSPADQPLYYMAQATMAEQRQDLPGATNAWNQAIASATTPLQADKFKAALERAKILLDPSTIAGDVPTLEKQLQDPTLDASTHANLACELAVIYDKSNHADDALKLLSNELMRVGLSPENLDALRLEYVILDRANPTAAKTADDVEKLKNILDDWPDKTASNYNQVLQFQENALSLLQNILTSDPASLPTDLEAYIQDKIADKRGHPLLKQLYLLQTQLELVLAQAYDSPNAEKHSPAATTHYAAADLAAQKLLELSSSPERDPARESAWNARYIAALNQTPPAYRDAATYLLDLYNSLHAAVPDSLETKQVTLRLADLNFLNGEASRDPQDYLTAARYYADLLDDPPPETDRGTILGRAVESDLKAGQVDAARKLLDQKVAQFVTIDPLNRWRAEFNVLLAMQDSGPDGAAQAFKRLEGILDETHVDALPASLQLRLRWLDAMLAYDQNDPSALQKGKKLQEVASQVLALNNSIPDLNVHELEAQGLLFQMKVQALAGHTTEEGDLYTTLNSPNYADTEAAVSAKFIKAQELADQNKYEDAEQLIKKLADDLDTAPNPAVAKYAPDARFKEALYAKHLDSTNQYKDALRILTDFVNAYRKDQPYYAHNPLIYQVIEEQGELKSESGDLQAAAEYFSELINMLDEEHFPDSDPLKAYALEKRAQCFISIAGASNADKDKRNKALTELERLYEKSELPLNVQMWAGVRYAMLMAADTTQPDAAAAAAAAQYWRVIDKFIRKPELRAELDKFPDGRSLMATCLENLGRLEWGDQLHDAKLALQAFQMLLDYHLEKENYVQSLMNSVIPPAAPATTPATPQDTSPPVTPPTPKANANGTAPAATSTIN
ncbi:MAG TPA: hypothetical protein VK737_08465 [Opitutales bacterium]|nr:hypothetical protein [Opitutales bacterium]